MESVTIHWIVFMSLSVCRAFSLSAAGPLAIGGQYTVEELYPSDESGRLNVAYRILAPTICCQLPVFIMAAICDAFSVPGPSLRYMPTLFYWLFLGVIKHARVNCGTGLFLSHSRRSCLFCCPSHSITLLSMAISEARARCA